MYFPTLVVAIHPLNYIICFPHEKSSSHLYFEGHCVYFIGDFCNQYCTVIFFSSGEGYCIYFMENFAATTDRMILSAKVSYLYFYKCCSCVFLEVQ